MSQKAKQQQSIEKGKDSVISAMLKINSDLNFISEMIWQHFSEQIFNVHSLSSHILPEKNNH